jgi:histidinol-phosphate aminotransferase
LPVPDDHDHWTLSRQMVIDERAFLARELAARGFTFPPSQANFLLVKVRDGALAREQLLRAGLLVRDGAAVGFPNHLRIAVGPREANERLVDILGGLERAPQRSGQPG